MIDWLSVSSEEVKMFADDMKATNAKHCDMWTSMISMTKFLEDISGTAVRVAGRDKIVNLPPKRPNEESVSDAHQEFMEFASDWKHYKMHLSLHRNKKAFPCVRFLDATLVKTTGVQVRDVAILLLA